MWHSSTMSVSVNLKVEFRIRGSSRQRSFRHLCSWKVPAQKSCLLEAVHITVSHSKPPAASSSENIYWSFKRQEISGSLTFFHPQVFHFSSLCVSLRVEPVEKDVYIRRAIVILITVSFWLFTWCYFLPIVNNDDGSILVPQTLMQREMTAEREETGNTKINRTINTPPARLQPFTPHQNTHKWHEFTQMTMAEKKEWLEKGKTEL